MRLSFSIFSYMHLRRISRYVYAYIRGYLFKFATFNLFSNALILLYDTSEIIYSSSLTIRNCKIVLTGNSSLYLGSFVTIGQKDSPRRFTSIFIDSSIVHISSFSSVKGSIYAKWSAKLAIGMFSTLNSFAEIHCHESIYIGSFVSIAQYAIIADTNYHSKLDWRRRITQTIESFPYYDADVQKPSTAPIAIHSCVWIGTQVLIFKGTTIGRSSIVAAKSFFTACEIPSDSIAVARDKYLLINYN